MTSDIDIPKKCDSFDLLKAYTNAVETEIIHLKNNCKIEFIHEFKYLGSWITFDLTDSSDIAHRIGKASKALGALNFFWKLPMVSLKTKCLLYKAIPLNLLLGGSENWSQNKSEIARLERFHHCAMRKILGVSMRQVQEEKITNAEIRKRFENMPTIQVIIAKK